MPLAVSRSPVAETAQATVDAQDADTTTISERPTANGRTLNLTFKE